MASHKMTTDAQGNTVYKVQASNGRGRKVTRSWRPEPSWSARTIERELNKFKATLEKELASGKVLTRQEQLERDRQAALEACKNQNLAPIHRWRFHAKKGIIILRKLKGELSPNA